MRGGIALEGLARCACTERDGHLRSGRQAGNAAPQGRPKGKGKLDPHLGFFVEIIEQDGDITMLELSAALFDATRVRARPNAIHCRQAIAQQSAER